MAHRNTEAEPQNVKGGRKSQSGRLKVREQLHPVHTRPIAARETTPKRSSQELYRGLTLHIWSSEQMHTAVALV